MSIVIFWFISNFINAVNVSDDYKGTFCTGEYEYVVIDLKDKYTQYMDGQIIVRGTIVQEDDAIYINTDSQTLYAVYSKRCIYLFDPNNEIIKKFKKISNDPTYINVPMD